MIPLLTFLYIHYEIKKSVDVYFDLWDDMYGDENQKNVHLKFDPRLAKLEIKKRYLQIPIIIIKSLVFIFSFLFLSKSYPTNLSLFLVVSSIMSSQAVTTRTS